MPAALERMRAEGFEVTQKLTCSKVVGLNVANSGRVSVWGAHDGRNWATSRPSWVEFGQMRAGRCQQWQNKAKHNKKWQISA